MEKEKLPASYFVGFMFAILILVLSIVNLFSGTKKVSETENRELAQKLIGTAIDAAEGREVPARQLIKTTLHERKSCREIG